MKSLRKIIISLFVFVSLFMVFSLNTNIEVYSEGEHTHQYTNGLCTDTTCLQCNGVHSGWTALTASMTTITASGNYYLTDNLYLSNLITIGDGTTATTVTICLNGHVLAGASYRGVGTYGYKNVFTIKKNATLNITDCNSTLSSATPITHHFTELDRIWVWDTGETASAHTVTGGVITGGHNSTAGGAFVVQGTLNIYSGNFIGNQTQDTGTKRSNGGVIYSQYGTVNIYGGYFAGNRAESGGVVTISGSSKLKPKLFVYGGTMEENSSEARGGAISTTSQFATMSLYGGVIKNNYSNLSFVTNASGGAIYYSGTFNIGGTLQVYDNKTAYKVDTVTSYIEENVYVQVDTTSALNTTTVSFNGGTTGETLPADGMRVGITTSVSPTEQNSKLQFSSAFTQNYQQYFFSDNRNFKIKAAYTSNVYVLNLCYPIHKHEDETLFSTELTSDLLMSTEGKAAGELVAGTYFLESDLEITVPITINSGIVKICLGGYSITGTHNGSIIDVGSSATLELYDCGVTEYYFVDNDSNGSYETKVSTSQTNSITVTGGYITGGRSTSTNGSAINVNGGTFNMYGGTLIGNEQTNTSNLGGGALNLTNGASATIYGGSFIGNLSENGGAINMNDGTSGINHSTLSIHDCTIKSNKANKKGGAIYSSSTSDLIINGGTYQHNYSNEDGGVIYTEATTRLIINSCTMTSNSVGNNGGAIYTNGESYMSNSNINNNTAACGGGVYVPSSNTHSITLAGSIRIENNKVNNEQNNLYLCNATNDKKISVNGTITNANIGITSEKSPDNGSIIISENNVYDYTEFFTSDDSDYQIVDKIVEEKHVMKLVAPLKVTYHSTLHNSGTIPKDENVYIEEDTVTILENPTNLARIGYKFLGWNTDASATEALENSTFVITENTDLYAIWEEKQTITFETPQQTYVYDACTYKYIPNHDLATSFTIKYWINASTNTYNYNGVMDVGTYSIDILRAEDETYKALNVHVDNAIVVTRKQMTPTVNVLVSKTFTRSEITLDTDELKVFDSKNAIQLTLDTDYTVSYENNINAGSANVIVTLIGNYEGTKTENFTISPKQITPVIGGVATAYYSVGGAEPTVNVLDETFPLDSDTDYNVSYTNNTAVGTGHLIVTCCGNYSGTAETDFTILPRSITPVISDIPDQTYNRCNICPELVVLDGENRLTAGVDYDAEYSDNYNAGTATVQVTLKGNYTGSASAQFTILQKELTVSWGTTSFTFDNNNHLPSATLVGVCEGDNVTIEVLGEQCHAGSDYTASVRFTEAQLNYKFNGDGTPITLFEIRQATTEITDLTIQGWTYADDANEPTANTNFGTINYSYALKSSGIFYDEAPTEGGDYIVKAYVVGTNDYSGCEATAEFTIAKRNVSVTYCQDDFTYNGTSQKDSLYATFKNKNGEDIALVVKEVSRYNSDDKDFKNAGNWYVVFTFNLDTDKNNYALAGNDTITSLFHMKKANYDMTNAHWNYDYNNPFTYTGTAYTVEVVDLPNGVSVAAEDYDGNVAVKAGTYTASATFTYDEENYNSVTIDNCEWVINKATYNVTNVEWDYDPQNPFTYDGTVKTVELKNLPVGVTVEYSGNSYTNASDNYYAYITEYHYDEENYEAPAVIEGINWVIQKATYNMENVSWDYNEDLVYNGNTQTITVTGLPEGVTVLYSGNSYFEAGTYTASVIQYTYDIENYNAPANIPDCNWEIKQATYDMTNVSWNYTNAFTYDGTEKTVAVTGLPEGVTANYRNNKATDAGEYNAYISSFIYDEVNYLEPGEVDECVWTINKADIDMANVSWNYTKAFTYDGSAKKIELQNLPECLTVEYKNNEKTDADTYLAEVTNYIYNTNNYNEPRPVENCEWVINKAKLDLANAHWNYDKAFTYDGNEKTVEYVGLPENASVDAYTGNTGITAGSYVATVTLSFDKVNYEEPVISELTWNIDKADYNMNHVTWSNIKSFIYDGEIKKVEVSNLPEGVSVKTYENNEKTTVGTYEAKVIEFNYDSTNYNAPVFEATCNWEITKATYNMENVAWSFITKFTYDGETKKVEISNLPEGVTVKSYENNEATNAGTYEAKVKEFNYDTVNYNTPVFETSCNWEIVKATYNMENVSWNYTLPFTYDGNVKKVELINLPNGVTVKNYENNEFTNAGSYEASVTLNYDTENYNEVTFKNLTWTIALAKYDMSNVKWNYSKAFTYDGKAKTVSLTGLPKGVTATYTDNSKTIVGKYTASVVLSYDTENYEKVTFNNLEWEIVKADYDMSNVSWNYTNAFTYDKEAKKVELVNLPEGVTVKTYENNEATNAGNYEAKVTEFNYDSTNYNAIVFNTTCNWEINKAKLDLTNAKWDYETAFTYDGTEKKVEFIGLPEEATIESYTGNVATNAGNYVATVKLSYDSANYEEPIILELNWEIKKADYVINVVFNSLTVPEDNSEHYINVVGTIPSGVTVKYYNDDVEFNGTKEVGSYEITAKFSGDYDNYNEIEDMHATLTIQSKTVKVETTTEGDKPSVIIETEKGFPSDVTVSVEVGIDGEEEGYVSEFDYDSIKDKDTKIKLDEEVSFIFEIKLQREVDGQMVTIQPTDLDGVTSITVKILIPEGVDVDNLTRILHVHNDSEVTEIEFDVNKLDADRYYEIEISKLSEFAFITKKDCTAHWVLIGILVAYIAFFIIWVFVMKNFKFDTVSVPATIVYGIAWLVSIFFACCYKCIIFAVIDFLVLIISFMLLGTNGARNLVKFLTDHKPDNNGKEENESKNKEESDRFNENLESIKAENESYEERRLTQMYEKIMTENIPPQTYDGKDKIEVVGVCFANVKRIYKFYPNGHKVHVGDKVTVEGEDGMKTGRVVHENYYAKPVNGITIKNIINVLK